VTTLAINLVATEALDVGALQEYFFAGLRVAAEESLLIRDQDVILRFRCLKFGNLLLYCRRRVLAGGFKQIELQLFRDLTGDESVEPFFKDVFSCGRFERSERGERGLLFTCRAALERGSELFGGI